MWKNNQKGVFPQIVFSQKCALLCPVEGVAAPWRCTKATGRSRREAPARRDTSLLLGNLLLGNSQEYHQTFPRNSHIRESGLGIGASGFKAERCSSVCWQSARRTPWREPRERCAWLKIGSCEDSLRVSDSSGYDHWASEWIELSSFSVELHQEQNQTGKNRKKKKTYVKLNGYF